MPNTITEKSFFKIPFTKPPPCDDSDFRNAERTPPPSAMHQSTCQSSRRAYDSTKFVKCFRIELFRINSFSSLFKYFRKNYFKSITNKGFLFRYFLLLSKYICEKNNSFLYILFNKKICFQCYLTRCTILRSTFKRQKEPKLLIILKKHRYYKWAKSFRNKQMISMVIINVSTRQLFLFFKSLFNFQLIHNFR